MAKRLEEVEYTRMVAEVKNQSSLTQRVVLEWPMRILKS